jgi:hypothetical protein
MNREHMIAPNRSIETRNTFLALVVSLLLQIIRFFFLAFEIFSRAVPGIG